MKSAAVKTGAKCNKVSLQTDNKTAVCTVGRTVLQHTECCP